MDQGIYLQLDQKLDVVLQELQDERAKNEAMREDIEELKHERKHEVSNDKDSKDQRLAKMACYIIEALQKKKEGKISKHAFSFTKYDGWKDACTILAWLSSLDDYFQGEKFSERDKIKCAANQLNDCVALWWNVTRKSHEKPDTWKAF